MSAEEETRTESAPGATRGDVSPEDALAEDLFLDPDDDPTTGGEPSEADALRARVEALEAEKRELNDRFLRKAADLENQRRRHQGEKEALHLYAAEGVLREMVSVLDDLERAVEHLGSFARSTEASNEAMNVVQGVEMVLRKFMGSLEKQGVKQVSSLRGRFDPTLHEAIQQVDDASVPSGTIVNEFQKAYMLHSRLLRPALVVVAHGGPRIVGETGDSPAAETLESKE